MTAKRRMLCWIYGLIAVLALIGTWGNNIAYLPAGFLGANMKFWTETLANPASRSITVDILFLGLAVFIWMFLEARRLGMRGIWLYVVFGLLVAISMAVPVFLIHRERALAARGSEAPDESRLHPWDVVGLAALAAATLVYTVVALLR